MTRGIGLRLRPSACGGVISARAVGEERQSRPAPTNTNQLPSPHGTPPTPTATRRQPNANANGNHCDSRPGRAVRPGAGADKDVLDWVARAVVPDLQTGSADRFSGPIVVTNRACGVMAINRACVCVCLRHLSAFQPGRLECLDRRPTCQTNAERPGIPVTHQGGQAI